jgi:hypothetical protein
MAALKACDGVARAHEARGDLVTIVLLLALGVQQFAPQVELAVRCRHSSIHSSVSIHPLISYTSASGYAPVSALEKLKPALTWTILASLSAMISCGALTLAMP